MRIFTSMLIAMAMFQSNVAAQQRGAVELGGFADAAYFDRSLLLDQGTVGPGGLFGLFLSRHLEVEGEAARVKVDGPASSNVTYVPVRGRLTYNLPVGQRAALLLGAGYVHTFYRGNADADDNGATGLVGLRLAIVPTLQLRVGSYLDFMPSPSNGNDKNINWGLTAGLSYLLGNKHTPRDADRDGVSDITDRCPGTPAGATVDENGCAASERDSDHDGVNDSADHCAGTPMGERVNAEGCPLPKDADGDKVVDANDACPGTPAGAAVDARGCAATQRDSDHDGVNDSADRCADTPANTAVDVNGCPAPPPPPAPKDSDGDGVMDDRDSCPNTAPGVRVDAKGCQIIPEKAALILKGVNFETGKAELTAEAQNLLLGVAQSLVANPEVRVEVQGHTDNTGSRALNVRLSKARAEAVRSFLVEHGVAADRLTAKGYGPDRPVASNTTVQGRAENRRVALERTP